MRTRKGAARTQARRRIMRRAKGYVGGRHRLYRTAKEAVVRAGVYAYRDRRRRRRDFRRLWIIRLSAAVRQRGLSYSQFIYGLARSGIALNRKILSEMAIHDPASFDVVVAQVKEALSA
ncbi:MAG: 50S ribosomal protein L20 [Pirellulaceae bacterium]|nr:MAG: 50S ribosomal protein L20 [Pirellulaceae bacterium]